MTADLPVPILSLEALDSADLTYTDDTPEQTVRAIAGPVVAAVLREFADHADREFDGEDREQPYARGVLDAARQARRRAEQYDPEEKS